MIEVNLHPEGSKRRRRGRRLPKVPGWLQSTGGGDGRDPWLIAAVAIPALVLLVVGWFWMSQRSDRGALDERITEAVEDSARLSDLRALSDSLMAREAQIRERLDLLRGLDDGRFVWPRLLDELSRALPNYAWLTSIREASAVPDLQVQVDGMAANPLAITAYVRRLQESPFVGQVRILGSQEQDVDGFSAHSFKLIIGYAEPPDSVVAAVSEGT
ncbi:MAG: PilN domain-containing protein [Gemmatimonadetes bacterium]|nr:PilN domain-containing protein [Gemmatimonadota bacterium]